METTELEAVTLRVRMRMRRISVGQLAREAGLYQTDVSAILNGSLRCGPRRAAKLSAGIIRLGLDKEKATPLPPAVPVKIRIWRT